MPNQDEYTEPRIETFDEFLRLRDQLRSFVPREVRLVPGAGFGPLKGFARGKQPDLALDASTGALIVSPQVRALLDNAQLKPIEGITSELVYKRQDQQGIELDLPMVARIAAGVRRGPGCRVCGRNPGKRENGVALDLESIPVGLDIFRDWEWGRWIFVDQSFKKIVTELELSGVLFRTVETV